MVQKVEIHKAIPYLLFFTLVLIFFVFFNDYVFYYQEKSTLFIFSLDFLRENLNQPGGFVLWMGKLFSTFYYYPTAGAIILSSILTLTMISVRKILNSLNGRKAGLIPLIIGIILFYLNTDYHFLLFNSLAILLQLNLLYLLISHPAFLKGWLPVIMAPLSYYLAGGFAWIFLLFITIYFLSEKRNDRWIRIIALWVTSFMTFYISMEFLFFQPVKTLAVFPFADNLKRWQLNLFIFVAGIICLLPVLGKIKIRLPENPRISEFSMRLVSLFLLAGIIILIGLKRFDIKTKYYFSVEKLFFEEKFDEVIAFNALNPPTNALTIFLNNIALCETDKLDDNLFHTAQNPQGSTLFLKWDMVEEILKRGGYFYYTIGMINEAHRWAFENMVMKGLTPEGLKMLIKTDLINGNYHVASAYIRLLKKTMFYRNDARKFENLLYSDKAVISDKELGEKRQIKVENDFFSITDDPYINLEMILANDSLNRKAFEYRIAYMLVRKNFNGIAHALPEFEKFGYTRLPVHIEEAALALAASNKGNLPYMRNFRISLSTAQRWDQYLDVLRQYRNDVKSAEPVLRSRFGDTYWYYVFFR